MLFQDTDWFRDIESSQMHFNLSQIPRFLYIWQNCLDIWRYILRIDLNYQQIRFNIKYAVQYVTFYTNHLVYCTQISYLIFNVFLFQLTFAFYFVFIINVHILFGMCWKRHYDSLCEFVCICIFFMADHIKRQVSITYVLRCCELKNEYFLMHVIFSFYIFFLNF